MSVQEVELPISLGSLPEYPGPESESPLVLETRGQPICALLGEPAQPCEDPSSKILHVYYSRPAEGPQLPMRFSVWNHQTTGGPRMPTNVLPVKRHSSLFLTSPQEQGFEVGAQQVIFNSVPAPGTLPTICCPHRLCQARWLTEVKLIRSSLDVFAIMVGASKADAEPMAYWIVKLPMFRLNPQPGQAIFIRPNRAKVQWHYYAVPTA